VRAVSLGILWGLLLCGCSGRQAALDPAGPQARSIAGVWWFFFGTTAAVYALVMLALAVALVHGDRRGAAGAPEPRPNQARERRAGFIAGGAVGLTALILFAFLISDMVAGRSIQTLDDAEGALEIKITGHQWWWDVEYQDPDPSKNLRTANEFHIPVGRPVKLRLASTDVIHSFWAPNLHGKKDLVPGHPTTLTIRADRAAAFGGQCAEYCGDQHAQMRFDVVAEPPEAFERWMAGALAPAPEPATESQKRGRELFLTTTCATCHTIAGTTAASRVGPDLTHVGSRRWIAGGALANTRGNLAGWLVNPQHIKPGVRMPDQALSPGELSALLDYLETLR
jgi:cytochrome c oxidase subunit 2